MTTNTEVAALSPGLRNLLIQDDRPSDTPNPSIFNVSNRNPSSASSPAKDGLPSLSSVLPISSAPSSRRTSEMSSNRQSVSPPLVTPPLHSMPSPLSGHQHIGALSVLSEAAAREKELPVTVDESESDGEQSESKRKGSVPSPLSLGQQPRRPSGLFALLNESSHPVPAGSVQYPTYNTFDPLVDSPPFRYHLPPNLSTAPPIPTSASAWPTHNISRRYSSQPYEYHRPLSSHTFEQGTSGSIGVRAPISRTTKACNACRNRKVRCDAGGVSSATGAEPATCSRCKESGVECIYSGPQKKRGPCPGTARPSTGKSRKSSYRNSVGTIKTLSPTEDSPNSPYTPFSRTSYGFPPPHVLPQQHTYEHTSHTQFSSFPHTQPGPWSSVHPGKDTSEVELSGSRPRSMGNWSHMSFTAPVTPTTPNIPHSFFQPDYTMNSPDPTSIPRGLRRGSSFFGDSGRSLPPLKVAITRRDTYYTP
ncbi:hypothetical protein M231_02086 [Tremella mesenterica]|uniref:Zn(2)-C6 fungal-type domain-containing protein n=1 Tax=Tremella mesenterica TaxID=5217 RepID=A0A4Q1BRM4_TREME|nr:hypothetical protein M231_02086 [Tremella mesenterica]